MPRAAYLNDKEKISIRIYKDEGHSNRQIALKIGRSEGVIRNFIKKAKNMELRKRQKEKQSLPTGKKKLSERKQHGTG